MNIHQAVEFVESSDKFKAFSKDDANYYLAHGFCIIEKEQSPWQVGYYSKKTKKIVVFTAEEEVMQAPADDAFRESGHVPLLDMEKATVTLDEALAAAAKLREEKYAHELVNKNIVLLQVIDDKPIWNLTLITQSFNMLNIRIDAASGEAIADSLHSLMNLGTQE